MDEDISIINSNTRNEKVRNFFIKNKVKIISILLTTVIALISAYSFDKYKTNQKIEISDKFNLTTLTYSENSKDKTVKNLVEIINEKDPTYSPLSLYFIIDNKLISDQEKLNSYFDIIIKNTSLDEEIKNLVIYKKALFNADRAEEGVLLNILPVPETLLSKTPPILLLILVYLTIAFPNHINLTYAFISGLVFDILYQVQ